MPPARWLFGALADQSLITGKQVRDNHGIVLTFDVFAAGGGCEGGKDVDFAG